MNPFMSGTKFWFDIFFNIPNIHPKYIECTAQHH